MIYRAAKRVFDLALAMLLLPVALPLIGIFGGLFALKTRGSVFFRQERTGWQGKAFNVLKLRTMTDEVAPDGSLLPDEDRLTKLGIFMRKASIDELPQLFNIIRGEMSFVGPRPQIHEFLEVMTDHEKRRYDVKPGITGWAQINGRNAISWADRFEKDIWYVDNRSFLLDLKIMALTPVVLLKGNDVAHPGCATMPTLFDERPEEMRKAA